MTTELIGIKKSKSCLAFTKANSLPNHLYLLTDPLINKKMKIISSCENGNLNELFVSAFTVTSTSTFTSTPASTSAFTSAPTSASSSTSNRSLNKNDQRSIKKYNQKVKKFDVGFVIPLNVDNNIKGLQEKIKTNNSNIDKYPIQNYFKINNTKNCFIYQLINNELFVLGLVIKNFFDETSFFSDQRNQLFKNLNTELNYFANNFKDVIKTIFSIKNSRHTYTIYGGCTTMLGHNKYMLPTKDEKCCHVAKFIREYMQNHSIDFVNIKRKSNILFNNFEDNKEFNIMPDIKLEHFQKVLKSKNTFEYYLYLKEILFPLIVNLKSLIKNLIRLNFSELYNDFNIELPGIKTNLSFFKSFAINLSITDENDELNSIRQGATDSHKDKHDCKYGFCVIVVFGKFEGGDLVLSEIGIIIEVKCGFIILIRSALLEHFNLKVLKNRFSIVYYLKKSFYNEI
jgi:hypothetical protein